ncbi:hypothetical protein PS645_00301 [Pseudomonas fluorescens]|uniref:Uncharacterized protein n=1 Tax=Pseudomonas fluorescens TaxID=294 RepID=A0A5E6PKR4_PSEFL|nr:hypothetical protein PS645_00301 [Pseudomonas fluorescens]
MSPDRTQQLEQALLAVIASATKMGVSCDALCAEAVGGLMTDRYWRWSLTEHKDGAADEIEGALTKLLMGGVSRSRPDSLFDTVSQAL